MKHRFSFALLIALSLLAAGCSRQSGTPPGPDAQAERMESSPIERYRLALARVAETQERLVTATAGFSAANWSSVAERSLSLADEFDAEIDHLKIFEEAAPAAAELKAEVGRLKRELRRMDAESWQDVLPDLALLAESIQSGMDELQDLAVPQDVHDSDPDHHHDLEGVL